MRIQVFLLISDLIKTLAATLNWALEWLFTCMDSHVIKETLGLFEEFTAAGMIARVHGSLSLRIRVGLPNEFELGEES